MAGITKSKTHAIYWALIFFNPSRESPRDKELRGHMYINVGGKEGEGEGRSLSGKENPLTLECYRGKQSSSRKHSSFGEGERRLRCLPAGRSTVQIEEIPGY